MRDSSDGELGIGLGDIRNGKTRLEEHDGLNKQIKFNRDYMSVRNIASYYCFLALSIIWSWSFGMPSIIKYSFAGIAAFSLIVHLALHLSTKKNTNKKREQQLTEYRNEKEKANKVKQVGTH